MCCGWCIALLALVCVVAFNWLLRRPRVGSYSDKHVLITGCDRGFGNMLAKRLDKLGFHVFATCLTEKGCRDIKAACSDRLTALQMDVSSSASIKESYELVRNFLTPHKNLWAVVNNAGIVGITVPYEWLTRADYQQVLDVNLLGVIEVTSTFLPLVKNAKGRIVNVASIMGRLTVPGGCYSISKYGVQSYTDGLRKMMSAFGICVSMIEPGFFRTDLISPERFSRDIERVWDKLPQEIKEDYGENFKSKYTELMKTRPQEIASDKTYLVVDAMEHAITGRWPKSRYIVGLDAKLVYAPLAMLPSFVSDFLDYMIAKYPKPQRYQK